MRSLNQESMSCALNSVSVLKCKGPSEKVSHSAVRQVRHSNNCSLLFLVMDLVYFPSLLPSNALEQAHKQGGWAVGFGISTSVLPRKHIARRALAKQPRRTGQGGLSWHLRSCPHWTDVQAQYRPFLQFRRHSTLGIPSAQQLVIKSHLCSMRRIECWVDVILALTWRDLLLLGTVGLWLLPPPSNSKPVCQVVMKLYYFSWNSLLFSFSETRRRREDWHLQSTVILMSVASKLVQSKRRQWGG